MNKRAVQVPISRLLDSGQTASAKVVWMALRLHPNATPAELEAYTGQSRHTVLKYLTATNPVFGGPRVKVPEALLAERRVGAQAKLLYGLLQATPNFKGESGQFTYASLCSLTRLGPNTLKRSISDLAATGWVQLSQTNRLNPIQFRLSSPELSRSQREVVDATRRMKRAKFGGEALMQEYLSLLIDSDQFTDNARPGFLINPQTGERLELDRFYTPHVAFEFNGAQHYRATGQFSQAEADAQHLRDLIKAGICLYRGIRLVIIHPEDLSLQGMLNKIGQSMPLRNLTGRDRLIDLLEQASLAYRASAAAEGNACPTSSPPG